VNRAGLARVGALVVLFGALLARRMMHEREREQEQVQVEHEERRKVDLSTLPPAPEELPPTEAKPAPKFKKKPVIIELSLKTKKGPFRGRFQVLDVSGSVVSDERATAQPATLILMPGKYEVVVPSSGFRHPMTVLGDQERTRLSVVVTK
jgi:hypothetical protein